MYKIFFLMLTCIACSTHAMDHKARLRAAVLADDIATARAIVREHVSLYHELLQEPGIQFSMNMQTELLIAAMVRPDTTDVAGHLRGRTPNSVSTATNQTQDAQLHSQQNIDDMHNRSDTPTQAFLHAYNAMSEAERKEIRAWFTRIIFLHNPVLAQTMANDYD